MKVFISFSSLDKKIAEKIYDRLKKKNIDCWICTKDIPPGADYQACIVEAINNANIVVLVFSSQANSSSEIAKELSLASKKVLIPVRIEDVLPQGSFQYQLSNRQFIDLFEDFDDKLEDLADRIKAVLDNGVDNGVSTTSVRPKSKFKISKLIKPSVIFTVVIGLAVFAYFVITKQSVSLAPQQSVTIEAPTVNSISSTETKTAPPTLPVPSPVPVPQVSQVSQELAANVELAPVTVSDKVNGLLVLVGNSTSYQRINAIKAITDQLPNPINYLEATKLLNGTEEQRADAISILAQNLTSNLGGKEVAVILGDTNNYQRLNSIKSLSKASKFKDNLQADEANLILEDTVGQRADAISILAQNLTSNLGGKEVAVILGDTNNYQRLNSIKSLSKASKFKDNLQADEANLILDDTVGQRADAISILAQNLTSNLGGKEVAVILGDTNNYQRLNSIKSLSKARKIKNGLSSDEVDLILEGLESQKIDGLKLLTPYLAK